MVLSRISNFLPLATPAITPETLEINYSLITKRVALCASAVFAAMCIGAIPFPAIVGMTVATSVVHALVEITQAATNRLAFQDITLPQVQPAVKRRRRRRKGGIKRLPNPQYHNVFVRGRMYRRAINMVSAQERSVQLMRKSDVRTSSARSLF